MKSDLRRSGIEIIGEVPWGTHFCQFYHSKEDLLEILVPYFKQGLENNEFCMWVTSEPLGVEDAKAALKEKVKNLDEYIKKGQIEILDYSQWYTKTGRFETDKVLEGWVKKEEQAVERGFDGLRLTGNTFWLENKDWKNFANYEAIVNSVIGKYRMLAVCSYSLDRCQASEIVDVVSNHQFALIKKEGKWVSLESSERKRVEEEIASLARFPSENPLPVLRVAEDGTILYSNEKGLKILAGWDTKVGSKVPERWCRLVKERFDTGKTGQEEEEEEEEEEEDKIFSIMIAPIKEAGYANLYFHDITERKKAQETLRASEIKNRTLLENIPQKVFFKDKNLVYISCNENYARDLKIKPEEIAGKTDYDFYPKDLAEKYRNDDKRIMESGKTEDIEEKYIQDEEERFVHTSKTPVKDAQRNVVGILGIFWDITERKNTEEALCRNEARYRSSIELTGQLAWTTDSNGEVVEDIPFWRKFTGLSYEEIKGSGWTKAVHPEDAEHTGQVWGKAVKDKSAYEVEYRLRRFDGVYRDFLTRGVPVLKKDGSIREWVGVNIDITERKRVEEALRESEVRYKALFASAAEGIVAADSETKQFRYVNPAICRMFGYTEEELMRLGVADIHPKESLGHVQAEFEAQLCGEKTLASYLPCLRKDGALFYANVNAAPVVLGGRKCLVGFFTDNTERKQAEEALSHFKKAVDSATDAIGMSTPEGRHYYQNEAFTELFGLSVDEVDGASGPPATVYADEKVRRKVFDTIMRGDSFEGEVKMLGKDRIEKDILQRAYSIKDKEGKVIGLVGIHTDITERKQAGEELKAAYKKLRQAQQELIQSSKMAAMGQLAAGVSHELNQPLTGIKGFAQAVLMDMEKESPFRNDLNKIVAQVDRMDTIIKNVRFFARKSDFKVIELDINHIVSDSLMLLDQQLKVHNIRVIREIGSDIPNMQGDPNQLQQAFLNIISNARDAIIGLNRPEGGEIRIQSSLAQDKNHIKITFQDTGGGIPKENLGHIFSPFFTTKSPDRGMGLGLSITYRIIENHQGKIEFKSKEGQGTVFNIVLPLQVTEHKIKQS